MKSHEQRVQQVRRQIALHRLRHRRRVAQVLLGVCLVFALGVWAVAPTTALKGSYGGFLGAASLFATGGAAGYVLVGVVSFVLGVCACLLGLYIRRLQEEEHRDRDN